MMPRRNNLSAPSTFFRLVVVASASLLLLLAWPVMSFAGEQPTSSCAVVGCGVLGTSLCKQILESSDFDDWTITGITKTTNNHESIRTKVGGSSDRLELLTNEDAEGRKFQNVVFCAPPSGFEDYPGAVEQAVKELWAGTEEGGTFVFTSSGGIYGPGKDYQKVTELSPIADPDSNPRIARLIKAEDTCRNNGGCVLRLAGLYTYERGAHGFWLKSGKDVSGRSDGLINLLSYDDAASACMAALKVGSSVVSGKTYLISDSHPMTREEICEAALKVKLFHDKTMPKFLGDENDSIGKVYDGSFSDKELQWSPRYASFGEFMATQE